MIELGRTRDELLADIDASTDLFVQPAIDPASPDLGSRRPTSRSPPTPATRSCRC